MIKPIHFLAMAIVLVTVSMAVSFYIQRFMLDFCLKKKIFDFNDERKIKKHLVPRVGGIGFFISYLTGIFILAYFTYISKAFLTKFISLGEIVKLGLYIGTISFVFLVGVVDDFVGLRARFKLVVEIVVAMLVYSLGFRITAISLPLGPKLLHVGFASFFITVLWIVCVINALNLIDGLDGLAGSIIALSASSLAIIHFINGNQLFSLLLLPLVGGVLGFLRWNWYPAKLYMGDSGSLFAGALLATMMLKSPQKATFGITMLVPLAILAVPLLDTGLAFFRRLIAGKNPFQPDNDHIHHRLLKKGFSEKRTVKILVAISAVFCVLAVVFGSASSRVRIGIYLFFLVSSIFVLFYLNYFNLGKNNRLVSFILSKFLYHWKEQKPTPAGDDISPDRQGLNEEPDPR